MISVQDKSIVQGLARQVAEIAALPVQQEKVEMWRRHNDLRPSRPMVLIFPEGSWSEIAAGWTYACQDEWCRGLEWQLRSRLYCWEHLRDDSPHEATIFCPIVTHGGGYGLDAVRRPAGLEKGACHFEPVIVEESDIEKIRTPELRVDWPETERNYQRLLELFDGILRVEKTCGWGGSMGFSPMDGFATWRGLDQMFLDLVDRPAWVHRVMQRMLDGRLAEIAALEKAGALTLNNRNHYNGSGGVGYTSQLPPPDFDGRTVRTRDLWAMATTQIFSEVSPEMHWEFALQYEKTFLERFGLANYGCCEPLHRKLDYVKRIRNLRRVSISPWADVAQSAEQLGDRYVFSWKPNPALLAAPAWNPREVRRVLTDFCERTRGCVTDIIMKDTHTCNGQPERLSEWVQIALDVAQQFAR